MEATLGIPRWLDGLLAFNKLKGTAALELRGNRFAIPALEARGESPSILVGRLLLNAQHTFGGLPAESGSLLRGAGRARQTLRGQAFGGGGLVPRAFEGNRWNKPSRAGIASGRRCLDASSLAD